MMERMRDEYEAVFTNASDLSDAIEASENTSRWVTNVNPSKQIQLKEIGGPLFAQQVSETTGISYEALYDSAEDGTDLYVTGLETQAVRSCAIPSLLNTAKITGSALGRLGPYDFALVINTCLKVAKGKTLMLIRDGKVNAFLSEQYKIMPQLELLDITKIALESFGKVKFEEGYHSHSFTSATWTLPDAKSELCGTYEEMLRDSSSIYDPSEFVPAVRFSTSDTGAAAASLYPMFRTPNGSYIHINNGYKVDHKGAEPMQTFTDNADNLYAAFADVNEKLREMAETWINHPVNAAIGICKKVGISKKYASPAIEEIELFVGDGSITMHDLYITLADCAGTAQRMGLISKKQLLDLEDSIAKILHLTWKDFDVAGTVAW